MSLYRLLDLQATFFAKFQRISYSGDKIDEVNDYYDLEVVGLKRRLPLKAISKNTKIASFNLLGDVELVQKVSDVLMKKLDGLSVECFVGPEVKVVPLVHELARRMKHKNYVICRKSVKPHMMDPLVLKPLNFFPKHVKPLVIDGADRVLLKGKRVVVLDDVVSTGVTLRMINKLMEMVGADVVARVAVIKQGDQQFEKIEKFIYLAQLPIFKQSS